MAMTFTELRDQAEEALRRSNGELANGKTSEAQVHAIQAQALATLLLVMKGS